MPADKFQGWRVIEVYIAKICGQKAVCNPEICLAKNKNVAQMSKPIRVKVKYVQGHLISLTLEFIGAFIPIFDIWIGFGVMTEKLNHCVGILRLFIQPSPDKNSKFKERYHLMSSLSKVS